MKNLNKTVAFIIKKYRLEASFSQEELADLANIHRTYLSQIERGLKCPTLHVLNDLSKALRIPLSVIIREMELYELQNK
ncbi:helix-turn-helix domain-containing protein [Klebsiella quasipneumoniae]|mgnify:FL=1|uniref:helix-turn-helix domain-containing protein n=1 Tax=Klebsiella pneumoniae complex TaxID=3390273 RepID=UPI0009408415|nr:helix-turn-helix transcriptional regulator [Klebsiella pneumoniae]EEY9907855.1 helix-turn-helix transcriptional regulator [Escherichia coli]ELY4448901.1 helix-turn-helix transcriptional regulator [Cronobacter malonaticus]HCB1820777.1 helix-turn-helix transcriptional regulator [Citrobacter freundii]ELY4492018.1 helix-turn-helix transcriptional regulator [Cronobacter malonaticus]ELY6297537.1 helix-turn-helix transcriptional regulator [Cronobacter malonaticus]